MFANYKNKHHGDGVQYHLSCIRQRIGGAVISISKNCIMHFAGHISSGSWRAWLKTNRVSGPGFSKLSWCMCTRCLLRKGSNDGSKLKSDIPWSVVWANKLNPRQERHRVRSALHQQPGWKRCQTSKGQTESIQLLPYFWRSRDLCPYSKLCFNDPETRPECFLRIMHYLRRTQLHYWVVYLGKQ